LLNSNKKSFHPSKVSGGLEMDELELALEKRKAEQALRAQGLSRSEARAEVARMQWPALEKSFFERVKARLGR
jgi:hypothetical protein